MSKTVLLLGATSDIARALAHLHAQRGDHLILAGRHQSALEKEAADLHIRYQIDPQISLFDAEASAKHPEFWENLYPKPDWVYCVFGYLPDQAQAETDLSLIERTLAVNFTGAVSILQLVANNFAARGHGTIIGISSVAGERGRGSNYFYGSAKAGFTAFLSGLRNRYQAKGVHVLTVKPGYVYTAMTAEMELPPPLTATPERVAKDMLKAIQRKKSVLYTKWIWRYIMWVIRIIPERIFMKLSL